MYTITVVNENGKEVRLYTTTDINHAYRELSHLSNNSPTAEVKEVRNSSIHIKYEFKD